MHYPSDLGHSEIVSCYYRDLSASKHKTLLTYRADIYAVMTADLCTIKEIFIEGCDTQAATCTLPTCTQGLHQIDVR